jgi:phage gpG-like protein
MNTYTIEGFIARLAKMSVDVAIGQHKALEAAAKSVERKAKSEIGTYQEAIGSFAGWDELMDSTKDDRVRQGYSEDDPLLRNGRLRDSISHETRALEAVIGSNEDVMVYQELGTDTIPPRPVLGPALLRKEDRIVKLLGNYTATAMLDGAPFSQIPTIDGDF